MTKKTHAIIVIFFLLVLFFVCNTYEKKINNISENNTIKTDTIHTSDTIIIFDTLKIEEPVPYIVEVYKYDTIAKIDTLIVTVPIERKTYQDEQYKAVIEGYKPNLISMDIYNKNIYVYDSIFVNNTITKYKRPKWVLSGGVGVGYTPRGLEPYVGVNIGYVFWSK